MSILLWGFYGLSGENTSSPIYRKVWITSLVKKHGPIQSSELSKAVSVIGRIIC